MLKPSSGVSSWEHCFGSELLPRDVQTVVMDDVMGARTRNLRCYWLGMPSHTYSKSHKGPNVQTASCL